MMRERNANKMLGPSHPPSPQKKCKGKELSFLYYR